jgi:fructose PTS system EIIBC or EIIC component
VLCYQPRNPRIFPRLSDDQDFEAWFMNLSEILSAECIRLDITSQTKTDAIREIAGLAANSDHVADMEKLIDALMIREKIQTTGIGHGMAIPHATAEGVKGLVLALGISKKGVPFDSLDDQPVNLVFLLAGEPRLQTSFLSILSKISRFFRKESFRNEVLKASSPEEILHLIQSREEQ